MRFLPTAIAIFIIPLAGAYAPTSALGSSSSALSALQTKAEEAQPRDRCFIYAELVSQMTEVAGQQFNSGDPQQASMTLKLVQRYAEKILTTVADDTTKLKKAELLLQRTSFRLKDILGEASYEDRPALEATLKQVNQLQGQLMMQVFRK
jgi:hypothetical protein